MAKLTFAENPVHPLVNAYPAVLMPFSLACDLLYFVTRRPTLRNAALLAQLGALGTGAAAVATGYADYETIPEGTDAKRLANAHALVNVASLGAIALGVLVRLPGRVRPLAFLLNIVANAGLLASGWYGSHLVYRHGVRVRGVDPTAGSRNSGEDPGKPFADQLEWIASRMPDRDLRAVIGAGPGDNGDASDNPASPTGTRTSPTGTVETPVTVAAIARTNLTD